MAGLAIGVSIGLVAAFLGLGPWLVTGARLPLQNLWASEALPQDMPFVLLPISQYETTTILALLVTGAALAGFGQRWWGSAVGARTWAVALGVGLVQVLALTQSLVEVARGLGLTDPGAFGAPDPRAALYLAGMLGGCVAALALGLAVCALAAHPPRAAAAIAAGLVAVPVAAWVSQWLVALTEPRVPMAAGMVQRWLPALVVGVALGLLGCATAQRALIWLLDLVLLLVVPASLTAVSYGLGMRVLNGDLVEMAAAAAQLFPLVVRVSVPPALLGLAIAVVLTLIRTTVGRNRTRLTDPIPEE